VARFGVVVGQVASQLPMALVLIVGLILVLNRRDRMPRRARALALAGCAVLLVEVVLGLAWTLSLPWLYENGMRANSILMVSLASSLLLHLLTAAGLGLLIGSTLSRGAPAPGPGQAAPAAEPFAPAPGQTGPGYGTPPANPGYPAPGTPTSGPASPGYAAPGQATPAPWARQEPPRS
jgi:hypothetical protein